MNERRLGTWLWAACAVGAALSLGVVFWAVALPVGGGDGEGPGEVVVDPRDGDVPIAGLPPIEEFAVIWQRDARRPFDDPAQAAATQSESYTPPPPPLNVQLLGVAVEENGQSYAILTGSAGETLSRQEGQYVAGARIVRISRGSV